MSQTTLISIPSPSVSLHLGRPATTSLEVAKFFGKRHDHVVRDIDNLLTQLPENFLQPNFGESVYEQETPIGTKQARMFILYRDGFMLLVMGYTGKKAMQIKIAYIEAFNAMETELTGRAALPPTTPPSSDSPLTPDQQCTLQTIVKAKVEAIPKEQRSGGLYPQVWSRFNNHFRIAKYNQLPQSKLSEAIAYLMALEIKEEKKALPELKALPAAKLTLEEDIELFAEEVRQAHAQIYALREQSEKRIIERATEIMSTLALRFTRKAHPSEQGKVGVLVVNFSPYVVSKCQMALRDTSDQLYSFENPASLLMSYADLESRW